MTKAIACTVAALALLGSAQAQTYKWVDDNGAVHYGQAPPAGERARAIEPDYRPNKPGAGNASLKKRIEAFERRQTAREQSEQEQQADAERAARRQANCESARDNLTVLNSHGQISVKEGDAYRRLDEEQRQARIAEAEEHIARFCEHAQK